MGRGLALRWALIHEIWLGSRRIEKAETVSREYESVARGFYGNRMKGSIKGVVNSDIPPLVEMIVLTLPPKHAIETVRQIKDKLTPQHVIVSAIVPMAREGKLFIYSPVIVGGKAAFEKSAAELVAEEVGNIPVVSAFQTVPASYLGDLDSILNIDVLISGQDEHALETVAKDNSRHTEPAGITSGPSLELKDGRIDHAATSERGDPEQPEGPVD